MADENHLTQKLVPLRVLTVEKTKPPGYKVLTLAKQFSTREMFLQTEVLLS